MNASAQEKGGLRYKFNKGDVLKYTVVHDLKLDLKGSDPQFTAMIGEVPVKLHVGGQFENVVTDVEDGTGTASLERRIKSMDVSGKFNTDEFKFTWDTKSKQTREDIDKNAWFWFDWTQGVSKYKVDVEGAFIPDNPDNRRLGHKVGMFNLSMTGPKETKDGKETGAWFTEEELAIPAIHDHLLLSVRNEIGKSTNKDGKKLVTITGTVRTKQKDPSELSPIGELQVEYVTTGTIVVDFDQNYKRIHSVKISLKVSMSGEGASPDGSKAPIKGEITYEESQTLKD